MKNLKRTYVKALKHFEAFPTAENAAIVNESYLQLVANGVRPWLTTDHAPQLPIEKGESLISALCDGERITYIFESKDGNSREVALGLTA